MAKDWQLLERHVIDLASMMWKRPFLPERIDGVNFDAVARISDDEVVIIEITKERDLDKVRQGVSRLSPIRHKLMLQGTFARCYIVTADAPTKGMQEFAEGQKIKLYSVDQFAAQAYPHKDYLLSRGTRPFGSAITVASREADVFKYIPVSYLRRPSGKKTSLAELAKALLQGNRIVLLGDFGTGKSRCIKELFFQFAQDVDRNLLFPIAINLRDHWGAETAIEILSGHLQRCGVPTLLDRSLQLLQAGKLVLLLDGFDEVGAQTFSAPGDRERRGQIRMNALTGVRDLVQLAVGPVLITGRDHYFDDDHQLLRSIGFNVSEHQVQIYSCQAEFEQPQAEAYLQALGLPRASPAWLPKKPLVFQVVGMLDADHATAILRSPKPQIGFWNHFIDTVCAREAAIRNNAVDPESVRAVLTRLARYVRHGSTPLGALTPKDLDRAYEEATGGTPDLAGNLMLSRLCTLGRVSPDSTERQFVDMYFVQLLYADDIAAAVATQDYSSLTQPSTQELDTLGLNHLAQWFEEYSLSGEAVMLLAAGLRGLIDQQILLEVLSALTLTNSAILDCGGLQISGAYTPILNLSDIEIQNCTIRDSVIDDLDCSRTRISADSRFTLQDSAVELFRGVTSKTAIPAWVAGCTVAHLEQVTASSRIKASSATHSQRLLLAIIQKTFFQRGGGRKEDALRRGGFGQSYTNKEFSRVISAMLREDLLETSKADSGLVYHPRREFTQRMKQIRDELTLSKDPLWLEVGALDRSS